MDLLDIAIAKQLTGGGGGSGTDNYNDLSNLPKINDTTLSGNKSSSALGLQSEITSDSKLASDLVDDTNQDNKFVTSSEKQTWNAKQNAIDADHKINADYVDDSTSTNKFVTASDKETWNAKQNAIDNSHKLSSDLVDDANKTNKFVTSTEKNTWNTKQNAIDADHKLSSSLVSFTDAEAAALASGIDSTKVGQISTNQTNILYVADSIGKNLINIADIAGSRNATYVSTATSVTVTSTNTYGNVHIKVHLKAGIYKWRCNVSNLSAYSGESPYIVMYAEGVGYDMAAKEITSNGEKESSLFTITEEKDYFFYIYARRAGSTDNTLTVSNLILCTKEASDISNAYTPYALPNYDLTRLQAEDRAALVEEIDAGAKNKFDINGVYNADATLTISGNTITMTTDDTRTYLKIWAKIYNSSGTEIAYPIEPTDITANGVYNFPFTKTSNASYLRFGHNGATKDGKLSYKIDGLANGDYILQIKVINCTTTSGHLSWGDIMICTKAAFGVSNKFVPFGTDPFYQVPINHNMIYRGRNLGATLTEAQHTALSSGNFTDLYLGDYWTKTVTIPAGTYTGGDGEEVAVPAQTNITLKAVIADFDTFYAGYASSYAGINTHHAAVIVTGFSNVVWNKTNSTAGGYVASLIHKWLVGSALPQIETWFGSAKVLSHQKLLTNAITGDAASGWAWSSQKISLLSENQMYGSKVWGNSKASNGGYEPGEAFKHLNVFNHIDANLLFGNKNIWLRDIASAVWSASLSSSGNASSPDASATRIAPAALILLS